MLAATIIVSIKIMGVTLIAASLVIPPVIARLLTNSFARILILSTAIGAVTGFAGIYISYYGDVASGATIVLLAAGLFVVMMLLSIAKAYLPAWARAAESEPRRGTAVLPPDVDLQ